MDLRLRSPAAPVGAITDVTVVDRPRHLLESDIDQGFAGNGAPLASVVTASSRAKFRGDRAAVFVYLRRRSVRVDLDQQRGANWRLFLVSCRGAENMAAELVAHRTQ